MGETEFIRRHQSPIRSLAAFEQSEYADDWRDLMRLYMVRRTRSFIKDNYAETDPETGRKYLTYEDGGRSYFPDRVPRTVKFTIDETDADDQYARLYDPIASPDSLPIILNTVSGFFSVGFIPPPWVYELQNPNSS